jgi:hypothetical protein
MAEDSFDEKGLRLQLRQRLLGRRQEPACSARKNTHRHLHDMPKRATAPNAEELRMTIDVHYHSSPCCVSEPELLPTCAAADALAAAPAGTRCAPLLAQLRRAR